MENITFTHFWVDGFGWENTIYSPDDFDVTEVFGEQDYGKTIFTCIDNRGGHHIFKGYKN